MNSLALIMQVCLIASPDVCEDKQLSIDMDSPMACIMASPQIIAKWSEEHPQWQVKRWTCKYLGREQDI